MKKFVAAAALLFCATGVWAAPDMGKYNKSCGVCHNAGAAGAPKVGDVAAWAPRMAKGMDALIASVTKGMGAMPPRGMCFDCSTDDYKALIEYMAGPAK